MWKNIVEPYRLLMKIQSCEEKMCFARMMADIEYKQATFI